MTARLAAAAALLVAIGCAARTPPQELEPSATPPVPAAAAAAAEAAVAAPAVASDGAAFSPDGGRTLWDGVYTEAQSRRGEEIYFASCVLCHRAEMTGSQIVPPLAGEAFLSRWSRRTAGDLFEWVRTSMPPVVTARLAPQEYADVLAYIFSRNQFPAGRGELPADFAALRVIRMAPQGGGAGKP